jgi:hypothetical protein
MKIAFFALLLSLVFFLVCPTNASAFFDPLQRPNNFQGIHILFPSELDAAAKLVNSKSGEWGYVTIPIQVGDKDLVKWQAFMDDCRKLKIIPILRLSTEADPNNTAVWRIPTQTDILDFANFLNSLTWPIENRYVILFNETNRFDEWGGEPPDPEVYADLSVYAYNTFKERSANFYIIMGGLDNAAPNDGVKYMDNFIYLNKMVEHNPDVFKKLDGFASHSYPNPGFVAPPLHDKLEGITTYQFEYTLINSHSEHKVPVFITETGWDSSKLGEGLIAKYYQIAYDNFWNKDKDKIVAITPFLLNSQGGTFDIFSFVKNGKQTEYYTQTEQMEKTKGQPLIQAVKGIAIRKIRDFKRVTFKATSSSNTLTKNLIIDYVKLFF